MRNLEDTSSSFTITSLDLIADAGTDASDWRIEIESLRNEMRLLRESVRTGNDPIPTSPLADKQLGGDPTVAEISALVQTSVGSAALVRYAVGSTEVATSSQKRRLSTSAPELSPDEAEKFHRELKLGCIFSLFCLLPLLVLYPIGTVFGSATNLGTFLTLEKLKNIQDENRDLRSVLLGEITAVRKSVDMVIKKGSNAMENIQTENRELRVMQDENKDLRSVLLGEITAVHISVGKAIKKSSDALEDIQNDNRFILDENRDLRSVLLREIAAVRKSVDKAIKKNSDGLDNIQTDNRDLRVMILATAGLTYTNIRNRSVFKDTCNLQRVMVGRKKLDEMLEKVQGEVEMKLGRIFSSVPDHKVFISDAFSSGGILHEILTDARLGQKEVETKLEHVLQHMQSDWTQVHGEGVFASPNADPSLWEWDKTSFPDPINVVQAGKPKYVRRLCLGCESSHKDIIYKRLTPWETPESSPPFNISDLFLDNWFDDDVLEVGNAFNRDFKLYSSFADALADSDPWNFCDFNMPYFGFPFTCGPTDWIHNQWNSLSRATGQPDVAFYIYTPSKKSGIRQHLSFFE